jgi:hypothetical protein
MFGRKRSRRRRRGGDGEKRKQAGQEILGEREEWERSGREERRAKEERVSRAPRLLSLTQYECLRCGMRCVFEGRRKRDWRSMASSIGDSLERHSQGSA